MGKSVVVGLSGGVDSAVSALLLKEQGYDVIGLFMRNWHEKDENGRCTSDDDLRDARQVCALLDIPYYTADFAEEYYERVFKTFLSEYSKGRTPNPDVLCNKEIKFDAFLNYALKIGADFVATGHYCNVSHTDGHRLLTAKDENKDQTYFLNQLTEKQLEKVLFPVGNLMKSEVREIAEKSGIPVSQKKDSTGICFIGERNFRKFLSGYLPMKEGEIKTLDNRTVGKHNGVFYYTIGQRRGLGLGGDKSGVNGRWFVIDKDIKNNILYVSHGDESALYKKRAITEDFSFINSEYQKDEFSCFARLRHRQPLVKAYATRYKNGYSIEFEEKQRGITPGQYTVLYVKDERFDNLVVLGGGVTERGED